MRDYAVAFLTNAGYFAAVLFLPVYAESSAIGASEGQIGLIVAGGNFAGFLSSFLFGRLADVRGRRAVLLAGVGATGAAVLLPLVAADPLALGLFWFAFGFAGGMFPGSLLAHAYETGRPPGRFSAVGSLGWGTGTFLAGIVATSLQQRWSFALAAVLYLLAFLAATGIRFGPAERLDVPLFPRAVIRRNWPAYAAILVRHTGANMIWVIFPLYLLQDLRLSGFEIGLLYTVNAGTQFLVMLLAADRVRSPRLVFAGLGLSAATFVAFTLARDFWTMVPAQVALGTSWSFLYVGALKFVLERGAERATSSGLLSSAISISATVGPLLGGVVAQGFGRPMTMYVAAVLAVVSMGVFATTLRRHNARSAAATSPAK